MSASDLADFRAEWVEPVSTTYRGWEVFEIPPNDAGIAALMMLNILETLRIERTRAQLGRGAARDDRSKEARVRRHAPIRCRSRDSPMFRSLRFSARTSHGRGRNSSIRQRAQSLVRAAELPVHAGDTTYLSAVDREGNMVSLIQSNFASFGSGVVAEGTGFPLQNRGALFTFDRSHPNVLVPRKRPLHTIIPALMVKGSTQNRIRDHGRVEPVAGSCAVRLERRRSRHEHSGCVGGSEVHQVDI